MHTTLATYSHSHHSPNHLVALVTFQVVETFEFDEWQFVMIEAQKWNQKIKKPYSIASTQLQMQESKQISFVVKKTSEDGMSDYLTQVIQAWDQVTLKWPVGHYTDSHRHKNYLLVSTGSGLSPNVGLFQWLVYEHWSYNHIVNIFWEKTHADIVPEIEALFTQHGRSNITNFFHLSRETDLTQINNRHSEWNEESRESESVRYLPWRIQSSLPAAIDILGTQTSCFLCGKPEMVDDARKILEELWIESEDITFEKY